MNRRDRISTVSIRSALLLPVFSALLYADTAREGQECAEYEPSTLMVNQAQRDWVVVAGSRTLARLAAEKDAALLRTIASQYKVQCTVLGSLDPGLLGVNRVLFWREPVTGNPTPVAGEDCLKYDVERLRMKDLGTQGYQISDGVQVLFTLRNREAAEAALAAARERKALCFIGRRQRGGSVAQLMQYLRGSAAQVLQYLR
ncbi:MAG TPA: hypothetical protein PK157_20550 [Bryobacteraceae bacterium]|nr:hypothetical protein [Bryobacteraceae bacterium]